MSPKLKGICEFGPFRFDREERTLWRDGKMLSVTPKALDTLAALLESPGRLVEKDELMKAVWPDAFVEEGNLAVQISLLRKMFGEETYIETVPRRGYRFVAPVRDMEIESVQPAPAPAREEVPAPSRVADDLSAPLTRRWLLGAVGGSVAGGAILFWGFRHRETAAAKIQVGSVAILPFQMLKATEDDSPLGLGLTDAVITRLGSVNRFIVRPTSAVRQFDQPGRDPAAIGAKLGVDAVLDATIQAAGDRIRLNAQLVRTSDGNHLWADTFDLQRSDLFTLEDELASRMIRSLFGDSVSAARYRPNPEAFRLYTIGQFYRNRWTPAGARKAVEYAGQAIAIDPKYASAHALLANSWTLLGYFFGVSPREAYPNAEEAAQKALSFDEGSAEAHHAEASVQFFYHWNFAEAERHLRRALEVNPNLPDSLHLLGLLRTVQHRNAEGTGLLDKALAIDPTSAWRHVGMTFQYACSNQIDKAIEEAERAHELDPILGPPMFDSYNLNMVKGDHRKAVEWHLKQISRPGGASEQAAALREAFEHGGIRGFLEARIAQGLKMMAAGRGSPLVLAQQYAYLGRVDEAMRWVEKAVEERQSTVLFLNQHPMYTSLRGHPKFREIVRKLGL